VSCIPLDADGLPCMVRMMSMKSLDEQNPSESESESEEVEGGLDEEEAAVKLLERVAIKDQEDGETTTESVEAESSAPSIDQSHSVNTTDKETMTASDEQEQPSVVLSIDTAPLHETSINKTPLPEGSVSSFEGTHQELLSPIRTQRTCCGEATPTPTPASRVSSVCSEALVDNTVLDGVQVRSTLYLFDVMRCYAMLGDDR
jgi:hypothetical protein